MWFKRVTAMRLSLVASWTGRDCWGLSEGVPFRKGNNRRIDKSLKRPPETQCSPPGSGTAGGTPSHCVPSSSLAPSAVPLSSSRMADTRPLHPTTRPGGRSAGALGAFPGPARSQFAGWGRGRGCSLPSAAGSSPKWRVTGRIEILEAPEPLEKQYRTKLAPS